MAAAPSSLHLLALPDEILVQILRPLLVLPFDHSRARRKMPVDDTATESITRVRRRIQLDNGYTQLQTQLLLVCRALGQLGTVLVSENRMVKLVTAWSIDPGHASTHDVSLWQTPCLQTSVLLILSLSLKVRNIRVRRRLYYLCELRDLHFLCRYLLWICHNQGSQFPILLDVDVTRPEIAGVCDISNCAERLFMHPIYTVLNGELGKVTCGNAPSSLLIDLYNRESIQAIKQLDPTDLLPRDRVLVHISQAVHDADEASIRPDVQPFLWSMRSAERLWSDNIRRFIYFAHLGHWESLAYSSSKTHIHWEALCLRTLDDIRDQLNHANSPTVAFLGYYRPLLDLHCKVQFLLGLGYLNISHLHPEQIDTLMERRILSPTQQHKWSFNNSTRGLAKEAYSVRLSLTLPRKFEYSTIPSNSIAAHVYIHCAVAEALMRMFSNAYPAAFYRVYQALRILRPGTSHLDREWVRENMMEAQRKFYRKALKRLYIPEGHHWDKNGSLWARWFRKAVTQGIMMKAVEEQLGKGQGGMFEEALEVDNKDWVAKFQESAGHC